MYILANVWNDDVFLDIIPHTDCVLRFSLRGIVVDEDTKNILGYSLHYGSSVKTPQYPLDVVQDRICINYKKSRIMYLIPPLVLKLRASSSEEHCKLSDFVWLRVVQVKISQRGDLVFLDVDRSDLSHNDHLLLR